VTSAPALTVAPDELVALVAGRLPGALVGFDVDGVLAPIVAHVDHSALTDGVAEALAVLAQACRDHEQVRFDYERRDGDGSRRLVEPHQLVSAGRRWYLAAWDVRREDWRTFRVDRMTEPRLAGVRFRPRPLPADDAAAFVEQAMRDMPSRHRAVVEVHAPLEQVEPVARRLGAEVEAPEGSPVRVTVRAEWPEWPAHAAIMLASEFPVEIEATDELAELLDRMADGIRRAGLRRLAAPDG